MDAEIQRFEEKLNHFVTLFQRSRAENNELRQLLAAKSDDEAPYFSMVLVPGEGRRL